jgi:hypothetical protein
MAAALPVGRVSLPEIGRQLAREVSAKDSIKRLWRLTANTGVEISAAMTRE